MSPKCQKRGLTAHQTSQDLFSLNHLPVTNHEKSTVILIHQLSNFGVFSHKFFRNFEDAKRQLIQVAAKNTQRPAFLTQGTTYGRQTQSSAELDLELVWFGFVIFLINIFYWFGLVIGIEMTKPIGYFGYFSL